VVRLGMEARAYSPSEVFTVFHLECEARGRQRTVVVTVVGNSEGAIGTRMEFLLW
jgi:hypothetical protein